MELKEFLEELLKENTEEVEDILELQELMKLLPQSDQGFYFTINAVSNSG